MHAQLFLTTNRLSIQPLTISDGHFIFELLNTEGWIRFIGNRNITSLTDADAYIQKILQKENVSYWVVQLKDGGEKIGIVTYIKRDYLDHHDIGFAFLPAFSKKGYAYEAVTAILHQLIRENNLAFVLATTVPHNISSVKLLKRIGLSFQKEMDVEGETLHVYGAATDTLII